MKLPEISPIGSTEKLATVNPMLAVTGEGRAMGEAFSKIGNLIYEKATEVYQREQLFKAEEFNLLLKENEAQWHKDNDGKNEYSINELSPSVKEALGISEDKYPEGVVPGYVVKPYLKRQSMTDAMRNNVSMISDPELRRSALMNAKKHEIAAYQTQVKQAIRGQEIYQRNKTLTKYEEYMSKGEFVMAAETAVNSTLKGDEKIRLQRRALGRQQASVLNDVLWSDNIKAMRAMQKRIMDNDPTAMGYLSDAQQRGFISAVNTRIDQIVRAAREAAESSRRIMARDTSRTIELLNKGYEVNIETLSRQAKFAQKHNPAQYDRLMQAQKTYSFKVKTKGKDLKDQLQLVRDFEANIANMAGDDAIAAMNTVKMVKEDIMKRSKDHIKWAQDNGYAVVPMNVENIEGVIMGRSNLVETLNRKYLTGKDRLNTEERIVYADYLEALTPKQLLEEGRKVISGFGGDKDQAQLFWSGFKAQGVAGQLPTAAQYATENKLTTAMKVVVGTDYSKKYPNIISQKVSTDFDAEAQKVIGQVFWGDPGEMSDRLAAAKSIYVYDKVSKGDLGDKFDKRAAKSAIAEATGPTLRYKGHTLPAAPETSGPETERWLDTMSPRELELFGADPKYSQMFVDGMRDGKYTVKAVDKVQYTLVEGEGQNISSCKDTHGSPLLFSHRPDYITTADDEADVKAFYAKRISEGKSVGFTKYERPEVEEPNLMQMTDPGVTKPPPADPTFTETNLMD